MKKLIGFIVAMMIVISSLAYAGGDQNCGDVGVGPTGENAPDQALAEQNRAPNP
ncbi:MAG: hypothetical protein JW882_01475 [Deltaproteobacteria bacterium]|nr:hypothetical protein [Deltaproteobacteria bacterium]